jgi:hypothetical protein
MGPACREGLDAAAMSAKLLVLIGLTLVIYAAGGLMHEEFVKGMKGMASGFALGWGVCALLGGRHR